MNPSGFSATVDVRDMIPRDRHPLIFGTFDDLGVGEKLLLINDHDPKPLYYQFQAESEGAFTWEYLENGPEVWRVAIGKVRARAPHAASSCHCSQ